MLLQSDHPSDGWAMQISCKWSAGFSWQNKEMPINLCINSSYFWQNIYVRKSPFAIFILHQQKVVMQCQHHKIPALPGSHLQKIMMRWMSLRWLHCVWLYLQASTVVLNRLFRFTRNNTWQYSYMTSIKIYVKIQPYTISNFF